MIWFAEFIDSSGKFVAFGDDPEEMPVHKEQRNGGLYPTPMTFPSCLKFLWGADEVALPRKVTEQEILNRFADPDHEEDWERELRRRTT